MVHAIFVDTAAERLVELGELADEQIEPAVVVVIEPDRAGTPAWSRDTRFLRHVGEGAVAIVVIEDAASVLRNVEVWEAISVVIPHRNTHAIATPSHAGFLRHVGECAVAIVAIQRVAQGMRRLVEIAFAAVDEVNVHPAVIVVIEEGTSRAAGFWQVFFRGFAGRMHPLDPADGRRNFFERVGKRSRRLE